MNPCAALALRAMQPADYAAVRVLWERTENIGLNESDEKPAITAFLKRNPGLSPVAIADRGRVVGALLCGHDGRRGYLHHLAVTRDERGRGLGRRLVEFATSRLRDAGITKCNLFVFAESDNAQTFWQHLGWQRPEWQVMQKRLIASACDRANTC